MKKRLVVSVGISLFLSNTLYAGFDFGGSDSCEGGSGTFQQEIEYWDNDPEKAVTVGTIPKDLPDVYISLPKVMEGCGLDWYRWPNGYQEIGSLGPYGDPLKGGVGKRNPAVFINGR